MTDMHPDDIKAAIRKRGSNLAALAEVVGLSAATLNAAIKRRASTRAEQVIADFLGIPAAEIWPSRYDANGERTVVPRARAVEAEEARAVARKVLAA